MRPRRRPLALGVLAAAWLAGCACGSVETLTDARRGEAAAVHAVSELGDPIVPSDFDASAPPPLQEAFAALAPILSSTEVPDRRRLLALEGLRRLSQRAPHVQRDFFPRAFEPALADPDPTLRWRAAWALGRIGRTSAALRGLVGDPHPRVAERAARAVGEARDRRAVPALIEALPREEGVGAAARRSLRRISGRRLGPPSAWRAWWERARARPDASSPAGP